jgi:hypothetical protein
MAISPVPAEGWIMCSALKRTTRDGPRFYAYVFDILFGPRAEDVPVYILGAA